jgi:type IV fimbrial biogenesis protein FimT
MKATSGNEGYTLIELFISLTVIAIGVALAVPSFEQSTQKRELTGAAEQLASFLSDAQSLAVRHNDLVTVALVDHGNSDWCVGAVLGQVACNCEVTDPSDSAYCSVDGAPRVFDHSSAELTEMVAHSADTAFTFEPVRGIMAGADLGAAHFYSLRSENGDFGLQVSVLPTGRIQVCSYDSGARVPGYAACSPAVPGNLPL